MNQIGIFAILRTILAIKLINVSIEKVTKAFCTILLN